MIAMPADARRSSQWQDWALCAGDPAPFFSEDGADAEMAKAICAGCVVQAECLDYALARNERFGVWGGLSERERRNLKRRKA
jgi:WhiB family transcriptional regulator, redox-sensing transcriptional regulator